MPINNLTDNLPWNLTETVAPTVEPLSTADAKTHLRVDHSEEDGLIDDYVEAARRQVELFTRRALVNTTFTLKLDAFPVEIRTPRSPLSSVTSITHIDCDGNSQTVASSVYDVDTDTEPGRIFLKFDQSWPDTRTINNAVTVTFVAGFGSAASSVPESLRSAVRLLAAHYYEQREPVVVGTITAKIPMSVESLLWMNRVLDA